MLSQREGFREVPRARFTPLKIKLMMKSKPKVYLNLLQESSSVISRNLRLKLDERLCPAEVLNDINSIDHVSLLDLSTFPCDGYILLVNVRTICIRITRLSRVMIVKTAMEERYFGWLQITCLHDISSFEFCDTILLKDLQNINVCQLRSIFSTLGEVFEVNKRSMKRCLIRFDHENLWKQVLYLRRQSCSSKNSPEKINAKFWEDSIVFSEATSATIFFKLSNPFKLKVSNHLDQPSFNNKELKRLKE